MNREGYKDPTAEAAIRNASRSERPVTKKELINACWNGNDKGCLRCTYEEECDEFIRMTGHVPIYYQPGGEQYTKEAVIPRRKRGNKWGVQ